MTTKLDYGIFDCDTHCYETRDAFTRYLPEEFRDRAITTVRGADGVEVILAGHRVATFNSEGDWASMSLIGRARSRRCSSRWDRATPRSPTSRNPCNRNSSSAVHALPSWRSRTSSVWSSIPAVWPWPPNTTSTTQRHCTPTCARSTDGSTKSGVSTTKTKFSPRR